MKKFISIVLILFSFINTNASHVAGGDISLTWLFANNYELKLTVYRDCNSGVPLSFDTIGIYDLITNAEQQRVTLTNPTVTPLTLGDACFTPTDCIEELIFTKNIVIPDNPNGYYISTQFVNRHLGITNIVLPSSTGATFYAEIPNPGDSLNGENSTPNMGNFPTNAYFCVNLDNTFNFNITDADGDSLYITFTEPLNGVRLGDSKPKPYSPITWESGYSLSNIVGGSTPMKIDNATGKVTASPSTIGIFVFAVRVEEFRDGVKIGEVRRDIQLNSTNCITEPPPLSLRNEADTTFQVVSGNEFCYNLIYQDPDDLTDTIYLNVSSSIFDRDAEIIELTPFTPDSFLYEYDGNSIVTPANSYSSSENGYFNNTGTMGMRFCWTPECRDIAMSPNTITVNAFSYNCGRKTEGSMSFHIDVLRPETDAGVIPNVFTPNDDEFNDIYELGGFYNPCPDEISVEIYNRWGMKMYESTDLEFGWDGKNMDGKEAPSGTYYIIITGSFEKEVILEQRRVITLLR